MSNFCTITILNRKFLASGAAGLSLAEIKHLNSGFDSRMNSMNNDLLIYKIAYPFG
jgi:hypothetical protein